MSHPGGSPSSLHSKKPKSKLKRKKLTPVKSTNKLTNYFSKSPIIMETTKQSKANGNVKASLRTKTPPIESEESSSEIDVIPNEKNSSKAVVTRNLRSRAATNPTECLEEPKGYLSSPNIFDSDEEPLANKKDTESPRRSTRSSSRDNIIKSSSRSPTKAATDCLPSTSATTNALRFKRIPKKPNTETKSEEALIKSGFQSKKQKPLPKVSTRSKVTTANQRNMAMSDEVFHAQFKGGKNKKSTRGRRGASSAKTLTSSQESSANERFKSPVKRSQMSGMNSSQEGEVSKEDCITPVKRRKSSVGSHLALIKQMGNDIKKNEEERNRCQELEKKLDNLQILSSPSTAKTLEKLAEFNSFIEESNIFELPPGFNVINREECHAYFDEFEDFLEERNIKEIKQILRKKEVKCFKDLDHLFKIATRTNNTQSNSSSQVLERVMDQYPEWKPRLYDIVFAFLNFGVTIENCPVQELFVKHKLKLDIAKKKDILSNEEKNKLVEGGNNLVIMFEILHSCLSRETTYDDSSLCQLILLFVWLRMDSNYLEHPIVLKIQRCCSAAIDSITETAWIEKSEYLSTKLAIMDPNQHHHNLSYLAEFLPTTERGIHLRQYTSFKVLHLLKGLVLPSLEEKLKAETLYRFLKNNPIKVNDNNYYESYSTISLISYCFHLEGNIKEDYPLAKEYLGKICDLLFAFCAPIVDSIRQQDGTKIKNQLLALRCKITLYRQGMDIREASMERLMENLPDLANRGKKKGRMSAKREIFPPDE